MHHGQAISKIGYVGCSTTSFGTVQGRTIVSAQAGEKGAASADARSAPLDASSCALKLEHSLCQGMACDKGCLGEISTE
jgi:hypothetical protein